jgi:Protein of unknown function (DUF3011)/Peptidase inhibitor family I36
MKLTSCLRLLALSFGLLLLPAFAAAQDSVKCESNDGNRQYCGSYNPSQVQFDRQISEAPCIQAQTWGIDRDGLWVDRGCRATFIIRGAADRGYQNRDDRPVGPGGPGGPAQSSLTCSSDDGNRQYCGNYNPDQVRLDRQISGSPCTEGQTWGVDGQGLWVDRGCRATFIIYTGPREGYDRRDDRRGPDDRDRDRDRDQGRGPDQGRPEVRIWWDANPNDTWPPRGDWHGGNWDSGGACFYKDSDFGGQFFCLRRGEQRESLGNYGDQITSIRVFGRARATIFDDRNFNGARQRVLTDIPNLRGLRVKQKPDHTWNNRISSIRVE